MSAILVVNDADLVGWTAIDVRCGIEVLAGSFSFEVSEKFPARNQALPIKPGDSCEVVLDGELVITGYVDSVNVRYSATEHSRTVTGRSKTADLVDSSVVHPSGQFKNQKVEDIARILCEPYNIAVTANVDTGNTLANFEIEQGETVFDALDRLSQIRGLIVTDNPQGNIVIDKVGESEAETAIVNGQNILEGNLIFDNSNRYKTVIARGQSTGSDEDFGLNTTRIEAQAEDTNLARTRTLIVQIDSDADITTAEKVSQWEVAARRGNSVTLNYVVQGWTSNGQFWKPGQFVQVADNFANIPVEEFVISEVSYKLSNDGGSITELTVKPTSAFETNPVVDDKVGLENENREILFN